MESTKTITAISVYSGNLINDNQYNKLSQIARRYVGTIYRLSDNTIIIIFGLPIAYGDDHNRAIEAAGELRSNFGSFQIGISIGDILIRPDLMIDYKQMELTTEACNLANAAEPGQILINSRLHSLVKKIFNCKQHQQPVLCYEIIGISDKIKRQLKSSNHGNHLSYKIKSTNIRQRNQRSRGKRSRTKFNEMLRKWVNKALNHVYYPLIAITIIICILAVLYWGC